MWPASTPAAQLSHSCVLHFSGHRTFACAHPSVEDSSVFLELTSVPCSVFSSDFVALGKAGGKKLQCLLCWAQFFIGEGLLINRRCSGVQHQHPHFPLGGLGRQKPALSIV